MYETMSDGKDRARITNELFDKLEGWVQDAASSSTTTYEKELYANRLLCEENVYERQLIGSDRVDQSLYSSVILGKTVCSGYALAFCAMMNAMDVDTCAALSNTHAWNVVRLGDGNYYAVDVCWNDTDGKSGKTPYRTDYLNVGEKIMSATNSRKESHTYSDEFAAWIPAIAQEDYDFSQEDPQRYVAPQNVRVQEVSSTYVTLAWDDAADAKWYVLTCTDASQPQEPTYRRSDGPTYVFRNLSPDTEYMFSVRCVYSNSSTGQDVSSPWTDCSAKTSAEETAGTVDPPTDVTTIHGKADEAVTSWKDPGRLKSVQVCQYTDSTYSKMVEGYPRFPNSPNNSNTWSGLEEGKTYYLGVRVVDNANPQAPIYSDWVNFSYTHAKDDSSHTEEAQLAAPTNIHPVYTYTTSTKITWEAVSGATGYEANLYEDAEHSGEPQSVEVSSRWPLTHIREISLENLTKGTTYYLTIRSVKDEDGQTVYSDWVDYAYTHTGRR